MRLNVLLYDDSANRVADKDRRSTEPAASLAHVSDVVLKPKLINYFMASALAVPTQIEGVGIKPTHREIRQEVLFPAPRSMISAMNK